ncbi:MAG: hypothetical protein Q4D44_07360 [Eubacteriales bacterium]|nr:hypothetical protein [Eubacteriales bacterium]
MDSFCEQVVKREFGIKQKLAVLVIIAIFALAEFATIVAYVLIPSAFIIAITLSIAIAAVAVILFSVSRIKNVEFDYSVVGNILAVDKVINKSRRKKVARIEIGNIEELFEASEENYPKDRYARKIDVSNGTNEGKYYCVYREPNRGKCLMTFSPKQKILDGMKPSLNRELMVKLFYKK